MESPASTSVSRPLSRRKTIISKVVSLQKRIEQHKKRSTIFVLLKRRAPLLLYLFWIASGTVFYALHEEYEWHVALYESTSVGWAIGWSLPIDESESLSVGGLYFSCFHNLVGVLFVGVIVTYIEIAVSRTTDHWMVEMTNRQCQGQGHIGGYNQSASPIVRLMVRLKRWLKLHKDRVQIYIICFGCCFLCILFGYYCIASFNFAESCDMTLSTLSCGGYQGMPPHATRGAFIFLALFTNVAVPLILVAAGTLASIMMTTQDEKSFYRKIASPLTDVELKYMQFFGIENGDGVLDKKEFLILIIIRIGNVKPRNVIHIHEHYKKLTANTGGTMSYASILDRDSGSAIEGRLQMLESPPKAPPFNRSTRKLVPLQLQLRRNFQELSSRSWSEEHGVDRKEDEEKDRKEMEEMRDMSHTHTHTDGQQIGSEPGSESVGCTVTTTATGRIPLSPTTHMQKGKNMTKNKNKRRVCLPRLSLFHCCLKTSTKSSRSPTKIQPITETLTSSIVARDDKCKEEKDQDKKEEGEEKEDEENSKEDSSMSVSVSVSASKEDNLRSEELLATSHPSSHASSSAPSPSPTWRARSIVPTPTTPTATTPTATTHINTNTNINTQPLHTPPTAAMSESWSTGSSSASASSSAIAASECPPRPHPNPFVQMRQFSRQMSKEAPTSMPIPMPILTESAATIDESILPSSSTILATSSTDSTTSSCDSPRPTASSPSPSPSSYARSGRRRFSSKKDRQSSYERTVAMLGKSKATVLAFVVRNRQKRHKNMLRRSSVSGLQKISEANIALERKLKLDRMLTNENINLGTALGLLALDWLRSGYVQAFILWLTWLLAGALFYCYNMNLSFFRGFYMSVNVGYAIYWTEEEDSISTKTFSVLNVLFGQLITTVAMAYFAGRLKQQWYVEAEEKMKLDDVNANSNVVYFLCMRGLFFIKKHHIHCLSLLWLTFGVVWSLVAVEWSFIDALYFSITSLSTGGIWSIPEDASDASYFIVALFTSTGAPILCLSAGMTAYHLCRLSHESDFIEAMHSPISKEELEMMQVLDIDEDNGHVDMTEYVMLILIRMKAVQPELIAAVLAHFSSIDGSSGGSFSYDKLLAPIEKTSSFKTVLRNRMKRSSRDASAE